MPRTRAKPDRKRELIVWSTLVFVALALGFLIGDGRVGLVAGVFGIAVFVVLAASRRAFLVFALASVIMVPTDWATGALVGVPAVRLPRVLAVLAVIHVARSLYDGTARKAFVRWVLVDSAVVAYFLVASVGALVLTTSVVYMWEQVVLGPAALYAVGRTIWADDDLAELLSWTVVVAATALALSVVLDGVAGVAHFAHAGADYGWSDSVSSVFRPGGLIGQPVRAATLCALSLAWLPLMLLSLRTRRAFPVAMALLLLTAIALTFTRAAWVSVILMGVLYLAVLRGWKSSAFAAGLAAATAAWVFAVYAHSREFLMGVLRPDTIAYRLRLWTYAAQVAQRATAWQLAFGAGVLSTRDANTSAAYSLAFSGTHNAYLTALLEHGVFGLAAYLGVVFAPAVLGVRALSRGDDPKRQAAGLVLIGLSLTIAVSSWSSELVRQYNVPSMYLLSVGLLTSVVVREHSAGS